MIEDALSSRWTEAYSLGALRFGSLCEHSSASIQVEDYAKAGQNWRGNWRNHQETGKDGNRRGLSEVARSRRSPDSFLVSFRQAVSGLGGDDAAGRRTLALANRCAVGWQSRGRTDSDIPPARRLRRSRGDCASASVREHTQPSRCAKSVPLACRSAGTIRQSRSRARVALSRHTARSQVHHQDHDRRS